MSKPRRIRAIAQDYAPADAERDNVLYAAQTAGAPELVNAGLPRRVSPIDTLGVSMGTILSRIGSVWLVMLLIFFATIVFMIGADSSDAWLPMGFMALFVLVGCLLVGLGIRQGLRSVRLARQGLLTWAVVTNVEQRRSTSTDSDGNTRTSVAYEVMFLYRTGAGEVLRGMVTLDSPQAVTDQPLELLLYAPDQPYDCQFVDTLPGGLRIGSDGVANPSSPVTLIGIVQTIALALTLTAIAATYALVAFTEKQPSQLERFQQRLKEGTEANRAGGLTSPGGG